jgi:hypothetical protein
MLCFPRKPTGPASPAPGFGGKNPPFGTPPGFKRAPPMRFFPTKAPGKIGPPPQHSGKMKNWTSHLHFVIVFGSRGGGWGRIGLETHQCRSTPPPLRPGGGCPKNKIFFYPRPSTKPRGPPLPPNPSMVFFPPANTWARTWVRNFPVEPGWRVENPEIKRRLAYGPPGFRRVRFFEWGGPKKTKCFFFSLPFGSLKRSKFLTGPPPSNRQPGWEAKN